MTVHLAFFSCNDINDVGYPPSVAWHNGQGRPKYTHVEIIIDGIGLCNFTGRTFESSLPKGTRKFTYQMVRLPSEWESTIMLEFNKLDFKVPYRHRDFIYASRNGHCARSLLKTGFTCASMAAYLLGYEDYAFMSVQHLYDRLNEL